MNGNLKAAFDEIRADDSLKKRTILYLQQEIQSRNNTRNRVSLIRYAIAIASIAIILVSGAFSYHLYFTPSAYVDLDVNPSVGMTLNRFNRVIGVYAYNEDGDTILSGLSLKHRAYNDALLVLIDTMDQMGYIQNDELVSVTLQTGGKEAELLDSIQAGVESYITEHHHTTQVNVFSVSDDTRSEAVGLGVTPAKYLAIQELIEVDPTVTVDSCRGHSISEIKRQTQAHGSHHDSAGANNSADAAEDVSPDADSDDNAAPQDEEAQYTAHGEGHHGESGSGRHHGNGHG